MKRNIKYQLRKVVITFIFLISINNIYSQSLKKLGAGLNEPVLSACSDSIGNIYAVSHKNASDSLKIYKFDINSSTWSLFAAQKDGKYHAKPVKISTSFTLKNSLYFIYHNDSFNFELNEITTSNWIIKADIKSNYIIPSPLQYKSIDNNSGVLYGSFDSINGLHFNDIVLFDGVNFLGMNYNSNNAPVYDCEVLKDTVFVISLNNYYYQKIGTGIWANYLPQSSYIGNKFSFSDKVKYLRSNDYVHQIEYNNEISKFQPTAKVKGYYYFSNSFVFNDDLILLNQFYDYPELLLQKTNYKFFPDIEDLMVIDNSIPKLFFKSTNNKIYIYSQSKVSYKTIDYDYIVELKIDSLFDLDVDTTVIKQFKDNNENYVFDSGDQSLSKLFFIDNSSYTTNANGIFNFYHYNNHLPSIRASNNSCETSPFTGNVMSKTNLPNVSKDTVFMPYFISKTVNLAIKNFTFPQARILDTIILRFKVDNKSCVYNNGSAIAELKLNPNVQFISSSPNFSSKNGNTINFSITNLYNAQSREIVVKIFYPLNQFSINDVVKHYLKITPSTSDMDSTDNRDSIMQKIVYSYDPNAKFSLPEGRITSDLKKIKYTIHFQNEGNDDARKVTIIDTINLKMPVYSFQMIGATHPYSVSIQPGTNIVTWVFDNINLKPKSENEEKSKGYLVFEANVRGDLRVGDSIRNKAYIYFDYNEPIITNYAVITRVEENGNGTSVNQVLSQFNTIEVYPNPTNNVLNIKNLKNENVNFEVFNSQGQSVLKHHLNLSDTYLLNCENLSKGIYFIVTSSGDKVKFVIQ